jgi:phage terminase small subunit
MRFVAAYLGPAQQNASRAAKLAGYSKKTARFQGSRLLTRVNIQLEIDI